PAPAPAGSNDWHVAVFEPAAGMPLPDSIDVQEEPNGGGQALVDVIGGKPMYIFDGDAMHDKTACLSGAGAYPWGPVEAAQLAHPVGDVTIVGNTDGVAQWAFHGKPLYTYEGDKLDGDAAGNAADRRWHVALVYRYYMPANVTIWTNHFGGYNLATT